MRHLALFLLVCAYASAQDIGVAIHDPSGAVADAPLSSVYHYADTQVGGSSGIVVRLTNTSGNPMTVVSVLVSSAFGSNTLSSNFTLTGLLVDKSLSSTNFEDVTVSFAPLTQSALTGYLQVVYQMQQSGCSLTSTNSATQCVTHTLVLSTLSGNGLAPSLVLSYQAASGSATLLQPGSSTPLNFGNVSTSASATIVFTLTNQSGSAVAAPAVSLTSQVFGSSAFTLDRSALPSSIPAGGTGSFTVTFAPGQTVQASATLMVGTLSYPLVGMGVVIADIDALQISYADTDGVRTLPQTATPISFGQAVAGTNTPATLAFTVTNPATSWNAVSLQTLAATGTGFALSNAPSAPLSIAPGASITFTAVFNPSTVGTYSGTLAIGTRQFSLAGSSITSALPIPALSVDITPLTSGQQAHVSILLPVASTVSAVGQLTMTFTPSMANVTDDPAIVFLATSGRQLQVTVAQGAQTATYNGQTALPFQTGTTAGTITFTVTFPNQAPVSQSFTIAGEAIQIVKATAVRQSPSLVLTIVGFDNTYTAGKLSFTFYDLNGKLMTPSAITSDASAQFSSYFLKSSTVGGSFSLQANFPVTGDVTAVSSVSVQLANTVGTTTASEAFQ